MDRAMVDAPLAMESHDRLGGFETAPFNFNDHCWLLSAGTDKN